MRVFRNGGEVCVINNTEKKLNQRTGVYEETGKSAICRNGTWKPMTHKTKEVLKNHDEVALAREQKMHYAALAMSTDYDCWKEDEESVSWELIEKTMKKNATNLLAIFVKAIPKLKNWKDRCFA